LLFARQSLVLEGAGKCSIFVGASEPVTFESHIIRARLDLDVADPGFFYYFFKSPLGKNAITSIVEQVAAAGIRGSDLARLEVPQVPLARQRAIADILGTLDDKIELNRRMNETLEAIARALFKSWFVDFDPALAKAEGRDPGLPRHLADLFPDSFEDSELGEIPAGWAAGRLEDALAELVSGARPKGGAVDQGVPSIGAENVIGLGHYDFSKEKFVPTEFFEQLRRKRAVVRPGDVLLYKDGAQIGRKTYFDCDFPHADCAINEHVFILRAKSADLQKFLFYWLDQEWMTHEIISLNSNSAQPGINQSGVRSLPLLIPHDDVVRAFDRLSAPLIKRVFSNCHESRTLAALRDTLLPKLISGQLRISEAEKLLERTL
jgi:type I restriction enzyme S subunit